MNELLIQMILDGYSFRSSITLGSITVYRDSFSMTFEPSELTINKLMEVLEAYGAHRACED